MSNGVRMRSSVVFAAIEAAAVKRSRSKSSKCGSAQYVSKVRSNAAMRSGLRRSDARTFHSSPVTWAEKVRFDEPMYPLCHARGWTELACRHLQGQGAVPGSLRPLHGAGGDYSFEPHSYLADDEHGVTMQKSKLTKEGKTLEIDEVFVMHFRDGKISEMCTCRPTRPAWTPGSADCATGGRARP